MQHYIEYNFIISPMAEEISEILVAELASVEFETFVDTETGLLAYINESFWNEHILDDIYILQNPDVQITYTFKTIEQKNWNEEWEKNFSPIIVEEKCTIRASFHQVPDTQYDIIIDPKMSFGTGHHQTTYMMLQFLLKTDLKGKNVLDMGCGTSVLAIMASKKEAKKITAIDVDEWCVTNSLENIALNNCQNIEVKLGDASLLGNENFDVIIANINRNILLNDIRHYAKSLNKNGILFLSGFYKEDISVIEAEAIKNNLFFVENLEKDNWVALQFQKS